MAVRRQDALGYQFGLLSRLFDRLLENELSEFGVSPGQFPPLVMLYEQDGLTQAELCKRILVEQPTMANTLNRMERDGLIKKQPDNKDKRQIRIFLTDHAKNYKIQIMEKARKVPTQAMNNLQVNDRENLFRLVARLIENLKLT